jgi:hypothetical protein
MQYIFIFGGKNGKAPTKTKEKTMKLKSFRKSYK